MARKRPSVVVNCIADRYVSERRAERIIEFSYPDGSGGLISFRHTPDGVPLVEVYRTDGAIRVLAPVEQPKLFTEQPERRQTQA